MSFDTMTAPIFCTTIAVNEGKEIQADHGEYFGSIVRRQPADSCGNGRGGALTRAGWWHGSNTDDLPVSALDAASCCAENFLANADRSLDESAMGRNVIDLAFMRARWGREPVSAGLAIAAQAYGKVAAADAKRAATKMLERADWRRRCVAALSLTDTRTLLSGLRALAAGRW